MRADRPVLAAVAVGGALGAAARYGLGVLWPDPRGVGFPWTTFAINIAGCVAIGVLVAVLALRTSTHRLVRPFVGTGVLGGFTTFSTYADQTRALVHTGRWGIAAAYVVATLIAALIAVRVGMLMVAVVARRRRSR